MQMFWIALGLAGACLGNDKLQEDDHGRMVLPMVLPDSIKDNMNDIVHLPFSDEGMEPNIDPGSPINVEDFKRAENLTAADFVPPADVQDPIAESGHFEGDIVEPELQGRNAMIDLRSRWTDAKIPYILSRDFDDRSRSIIARAMQEYHSQTCIKFVPRTTERNYIYIQRGQGCSSLIGMRGGVQPVTLGHGCVYVGIVIHELMHATGFFHEQSRNDRDQFIAVQWQNIQQGMQYNFAKYTLREIQHLNEMYDYASVMHYGATAFSKDNISPTIVPLDSGAEIGQRQGFSQIDVNKINKLYECNSILSHPVKSEKNKINKTN